MTNLDLANRIKEELKSAGMTKYGLMKSESRYLVRLIQADEHIGGVVYGRYKGGSAMLVATDQRVIFLDTKLLFSRHDELTYDDVVEVKHDTASRLNTLALRTRAKNYTIHFTNKKCAQIFVKYIESRSSSQDNAETSSDTQKNDDTATYPKSFNDPEAKAFLREHGTAVLSSADGEGNIFSSVIYYIADPDSRIFFVTKQGTAKARNLLVHNKVALTIFEASKAQTLNLQGRAEFVTEQDTINFVTSQIMKPRPYGGEMRLPPIAYIGRGAVTIIKIVPTSGTYTDYTKL